MIGRAREIEHGFQARPKDEGINLSVESAEARRIDKMISDTQKWMKDNKIKAVEPINADMKINGIDSTVFQFRTSDENGRTTVALILVPAGNNRVMMLTVGATTKNAKPMARRWTRFSEASSQSTNHHGRGRGG